MVQSYFQHLPELVCTQLEQANHTIRIAVCWFSNQQIFNTLLLRLEAGISVSLLIEYDSQNIREQGLNFEEFIRLGGQFYGCCFAGLMHHKFALIDHKKVLTGSFNWTYNSNAENLVVIENSATYQDFLEEYERQRILAKRIWVIRKEDLKLFQPASLFYPFSVQMPELRRKIAGGANVWVVRLGNKARESPFTFEQNALFFDNTLSLNNWWARMPIWDEDSFQHEFNRLRPLLKPNTLREIRLFAFRMKRGDFVLVVNPKTGLLALGIIDSCPQRFEGIGYSSIRVVQWLKIFPQNAPIEVNIGHSNQKVTAFRGSALRLLQDMFEVA